MYVSSSCCGDTSILVFSLSHTIKSHRLRMLVTSKIHFLPHKLVCEQQQASMKLHHTVSENNYIAPEYLGTHNINTPTWSIG